MENFLINFNNNFAFITPLSDFLWAFPTNFSWYSKIPIIGNFPLVIILLVATGIYFSIKLSFPQFKYFKNTFKFLTEKKESNIGVSNFESFILGTSMRVGAGNIIGVTTAIITGGPGALFWMWISGLFGMATAFVEGTLSQIFKTKNDDYYVGGIIMYSRKICKDSFIIGIIIALFYLLYSVFCLPSQGSYTVEAINLIIQAATNNAVKLNQQFSITMATFLLCITSIIIFSGIKKVAKVTNIMVTFMCGLFLVIGVILIIFNINLIPRFFYEVFVGAFHKRAIFGGVAGTALMNGVKRGLISNEAGQGTTTIASSLADSKHPIEQGCITSFGVFIDTIVICTMTGFIVVMAGNYLNADVFNEWKQTATHLDSFLYCVDTLTNDKMHISIDILLIVCFAFFSYTTMMVMISFADAAIACITKKSSMKQFTRIMFILVTAFGIISRVSGYDMYNLWAMTELGNVVILIVNIPILYLGLKYVEKAIKHYESGEGKFSADSIGYDKPLDGWENQAENQ